MAFFDIQMRRYVRHAINILCPTTGWQGAAIDTSRVATKAPMLRNPEGFDPAKMPCFQSEAYGLLITDKSEHVFSSTRHLTGPILFATRHKATCVIFLRFVLLLRAKKQVLAPKNAANVYFQTRVRTSPQSDLFII